MDGYQQSVNRARNVIPASWRSRLPSSLKSALSDLYWLWYDIRDYLAEAVGGLPSHTLHVLLDRSLFRIRIGAGTSVHRGCRFYYPPGVQLGAHSIINRDVLLDGRMGLQIGNDVSISEGVAIFTLEHDPNSEIFANRGAPVRVGDYAFVGARAIILPGVTLGEGAVVAAGAGVTRDMRRNGRDGRV